MEILDRCCAGLDVHKKTVVACARSVGDDGADREQVRTFGTMTADLLELADWLAALGVRRVAMESTGVYWKPVWHLLEARFELLLVNASTSSGSRGGRPTSRTPSGSPSCWPTACSRPASSLPSRSASSAT